MPIHNKVLSNTHLRKHWQMRVRTWFNQAGRKERRRNTRAEKAAAIFPRPLRSLKPIVRPPTQKYNIKTREGRGFTLEELKAAKLSVRYARSIGIAVDPRRTNISQQSLSLNAQRLKEYQSKLVLFPRKATAPKKGDATKAEIDNAVQNLNVLPFASSKVSVFTPRKVTEDEKKFQAYTTLRAASAKVKNSGLRKLAKEKKAAEAKDK
ncbi:S60 ribosomal protein L13 [Heterostelium album PN500]|uniref:S60 ribosomal protein L13 n=1 Tax=Heterostelium pallidum (strain ATCC 26659 / Pp 5 / PN500) TaxID=670386 RepID=D3AW01_HETP5|nr:S60 ribosomal protein L13 [Heterostelium album PN500]EFA86474.1 S60 ribosomal protein L13 [Heterostelium album PN500]|eukprot:XP_020438579.1 S60 ribosomal protein L13 [Heterostelium album PN500]